MIVYPFHPPPPADPRTYIDMWSLYVFAIILVSQLYYMPAAAGLLVMTWSAWWHVPIALYMLCMLQFVCKKFRFSTPADDLNAIREFLVPHFKTLGMFLGTLFNISLVYDHVLEPVLSSLSEVLVPLVRLLFSWVYVLVGFVSVRHYYFAAMGVVLVASGVVWYFGINYRSQWFTTTLLAMPGALVAALAINPSLISYIFPALAWYFGPYQSEQSAIRTRVDELMRLRKSELVDLYDVDDSGRECKMWYAERIAKRDAAPRSF